MRKILMRSVLSALSFAFLAAHAEPAASFGGFTFSSDMSDAQTKTLKQDIEFLYRLPVMNDNYGLQNMTDMKEISGPQLHNWILNRLRVFISEQVNPESIFGLTKQFYNYEKMDVFPKLSVAAGGSNQQGAGGEVIATNIGGSLYILGKREKTLGMVTINGKSVPVLSPRVGIVQVPNSFFNEAEQESTQLIDRLLRITTIFHEARHSDGNGKSLGFLHEICPPGHMLEGERACDKMENGSYGLEARLQRVLSRNCTKCKTEDIEVLRLMSLENFSRLILPPQATAKISKIRQEMDAHRHILELCKSMVGEQEKCSAVFIKETKQKYVDTRAQMDYLIRVGGSTKSLRPMVDPKPEGFFTELSLEQSSSLMPQR